MKKLVPHFGRGELYSEWGRSPVAGVPANITYGDFVGYSEEGDNNFPCQRTSARFTLFEHDAHFERARMNPTNTPSKRA